MNQFERFQDALKIESIEDKKFNPNHILEVSKSFLK